MEGVWRYVAGDVDSEAVLATEVQPSNVRGDRKWYAELVAPAVRLVEGEVDAVNIAIGPVEIGTKEEVEVQISGSVIEEEVSTRQSKVTEVVAGHESRTVCTGKVEGFPVICECDVPHTSSFDRLAGVCR